MGSGQMMPELGSRISLISKADIRYEGRLFTVDPQECTIALANVRSFGTEDRDTAYPIMPQPTVYDYILFRGSDIKDIRVVNNVSIPNDPAIMQMHLPPQQQPGFPQQQMPPIQPGAPMSQFGPFGSMQQGPPPSVANILGSSSSIGGQNIPQQQPSQSQLLSPIQQQQQPSSQQGNNLSNILSTSSSSATSSSGQTKKSSSRSGTPTQSRKSPTSDMGVQTNENQRGGSGGENQGGKDKMQRNNNNQQQQRYQQREYRDSGRNEQQENRGGYRQQNQQQRMQHNQQQQQQQKPQNNNNNNRGPPGQGPMQNRGYQGGSGRMRPPQQNYRGQNYPGQNNYHNQNYNQGGGNQNYQGQNNYQNQGNRQMNKPNGGPQKNQKTLKFENEFDFEKANSKFEELRTELAKLKVGSEETKTNPEQVNGEVEKKDDSGNETGADAHEQEGDDGNGYDKTKSFFDNISCEANERSKGKTQRTDWRQERKLNSETFGLTMNRRGNFRGRGYYRHQYGRPMNNNYRSGGGMSQYNNNRNRNGPQNGGGRSNINQPQQSQNKQAPTAAAAEK